MHNVRACATTQLASNSTDDVTMHTRKVCCIKLCCAGISIDDLPNVKAWMQRIEERPAVQRGIDTPEPFDRDALNDPKKVQETIEMVRKFTGTHSSEK